MANKDPKDARSTGRKRARRILLELVKEGELEYICNNCGHEPKIPWYVKSRSGDILDADHINKNILDNDPSNLQWLCRPCHKKEDLTTEKGESRKGDEFGYGLDLLDL